VVRDDVARDDVARDDVARDDVVRDVVVPAPGTPGADSSGLRSIRLEVDVPGTPEEVWEAVATGPGIGSWFVPAVVEPRAGGTMTLSFGPGLDETCQITAWEPPQRFAYGVPGGEAVGPLDYEFTVSPGTGGQCVVRLVNRGFAAGPDADDEYTAMDSGWRLFLAGLRLYREHFPGRHGVSFIANGGAPGPRDKAWSAMLAALGLPPLAEGQRVATSVPDFPAVGGTVARLAAGMATLVVDEPAPGIVFFAAEGEGDRIFVSFYAYLFGADAASVVARHGPAWTSWMGRVFPMEPEDAPA
jgi:uncharacterized protein YndB with AHSA1/START domain